MALLSLVFRKILIIPTSKTRTEKKPLILMFKEMYIKIKTIRNRIYFLLLLLMLSARDVAKSKE